MFPIRPAISYVSALSLFLGIAILFDPVATPEYSKDTEDERISKISAPLNASSIDESLHNQAPQNLSTWLESWQNTPTEQTLSEGLKLAEERRGKMATLIRSDPGAAIDEMLSFHDYLHLPTAITNRIETPFAVRGDLEVVHQCFEDDMHDQHDTRVTARWGGKTRNLHLPSERIINHSKDTMPLVGIELDGEAALHRLPAPYLNAAEASAAAKIFNIEISDTIEANTLQLIGNTLVSAEQNPSGELSLNQAIYLAEQTVAPNSVAIALKTFVERSVSRPQYLSILDENAREWTTSSKKLLVIRVAFANHENLETKERLEGVFKWVQDTLFEYSFGNTSLESYTIPDVVTLPSQLEHYTIQTNHIDTGKLREDVDPKITRSGYNLDDYDIVVYQWESNPRLGMDGAASSKYQYIRNSATKEIYLHETGHNFGLSHANSWDPEDGSILPEYGTIGSQSHLEYGDIFDRMGRAPEGAEPHFGAYYKWLLNWIPDSKVVSLDSASDQVIRIHRFDHIDALQNDVLLVNIDYPDTQRLTLSYRRAFSENENLAAGLFMQWIPQPSYSRLLDMTPNSQSPENDWNDPALTVGNVFSDPLENISVTPLKTGGSQGNEWIDVHVRIGAQDNFPPAANLSGPTHAYARYPVSYSIQAIDPEEDPLSFRWTINDEPTLESSNQLSHFFQEVGNYRIEAVTSDGHNNYTTTKANLTVSDPLIPWTFFNPFETSPYAEQIKFSGGNFIVFNEEKGATTQDGSVFDAFSPNIRVSDISIAPKRYIAVGASTDLSLEENVAGRIAESLDEGATWQIVPLTQQAPRLTLSLFAEGYWFAAGPPGILFRKEPDSPWQSQTSPWQDEIVSLLSNQNLILTLTESGTVYASNDYGINWVDKTSLIGVDSVEVLATGDDRILAVAEGKAYISIDGGENWISSNIGYNLFGESIATTAACSSHLFFVAAARILPGTDFLLSRHHAISVDGVIWSVETEEQLAPVNAVAIGNKRIGMLWPDGNTQFSSPHRSVFSNWMNKAFPNSTETSFDPERDADGDGIANIGEYGFNTRPEAFDPRIISINHLQDTKPVSFQCRSNDPNLRYYCSLSNDLKSWKNVAIRFDPTDKIWKIESTLIQLSANETEEQGVWEMSIRLTPSQNPTFIRLFLEYESPLP